MKYGESIKDLSLPQWAMIAGLPKAPSAYNPVVNPKRAKVRQEYILQRMRDLRYLTPEQYDQAIHEELKVRGEGNEFSTHAEYVAEIVRQRQRLVLGLDDRFLAPTTSAAARRFPCRRARR